MGRGVVNGVPDADCVENGRQLRRALLGISVCADCGAENGIGSRHCHACRSCPCCGAPNCRREVCGEDVGRHAEHHAVWLLRHAEIGALIARAFALGPRAARTEAA